MAPLRNMFMGRFQAARVTPLFVSVRNIELSDRDSGRSTYLNMHEETL